MYNLIKVWQHNYRLKLFILGFLVCSLSGCSGENNSGLKSLVNTSHLDRLYEEVTIDGQNLGIIHIYSDFPDYQWVDAPGEGTACIDDVARAAVFYLRHYHYTLNETSRDKAKKLLDFILYMQAPNGLFYNFIYRDLTINKTRSNSQPVANWWAWRAIWAMGEGILHLSADDSVYQARLLSALEKSFPAVDSLLLDSPKAGIEYSYGLPFNSAADQAAVLQIALLNLYKNIPDPVNRIRLEQIADRLLLTQRGNDERFPYGAFLSWQNTWHAWGNCQAYALLETGHVLEQNKYTDAGIMEVRYFHPFLMERNQLSEFKVSLENGKQIISNESQYPQIAYGIRPLVWANLAAYNITKDQVYARQAADIACWLLGRNSHEKILYDPQTGVCFDGLDSNKKINNNSGAESTIEALLTLIEIEQSPEIQKMVYEYYINRNKP